MLQEFKAFMMRGNVVDLAVGIIIGAAFTAIVTSLVSDIIMPPIGLLLGGVDFSNLFLQLSGRETLYTSLKAAQDAGVATLNYGLFVNAIIKFLIVGFAVFMLIRSMNSMIKKKDESPAAPPPTPEDILLLREIRDNLKK
jgi:large conductance mechanosensitive channel